MIRYQQQHLVLLLELHNLRQMAHLPFHAVDALDNDQNLLPRPPCFGLPISNAVSQ